jgi:sulfur-carrier protein adenylyltransferase/sulfurtransferase
MKEITVQEFQAMKTAGEDFQLIDVRRQDEYDFCNMGGELIKQGTIVEQYKKVATDKKVIIHCRSGMRSANDILALEKAYGFTNLYNLKGGILAYAQQIDPSIPQY